MKIPTLFGEYFSQVIFGGMKKVSNRVSQPTSASSDGIVFVGDGGGCGTCQHRDKYIHI